MGILWNIGFNDVDNAYLREELHIESLGIDLPKGMIMQVGDGRRIMLDGTTLIECEAPTGLLVYVESRYLEPLLFHDN